MQPCTHDADRFGAMSTHASVSGVLWRTGDLAQQGGDIARRIVAAPGDELIRAHQYETRRVVRALVAIAVADDGKRDAERLHGTLEFSRRVVALERQQGESRPQMLEDIPTARHRTRREVMPGARLE
jgi:hypothetical protein